jgi:hypothetical protein
MAIAIPLLTESEEITMERIEINRKDNGLAFNLSEHACSRMNQRCIDKRSLKAVLSFGRVIRSRGACFYVIGKRELHHLQKTGVDIYRLENTQVVVDEKSSTVITVYKNNNFRKIRPIKRCERKLH